MIKVFINNNILDFMYNPLEQFKIIYLLDINMRWLDLSLSIVMVLLFIVLLSIFLILRTTLNGMNKIGYLVLTFYMAIIKEYVNILGIRNTNYVSLVTFLFYYTLICNLLGLIPYSFTLTSQICVTVFWSTVIMISVTIIGIIKHNYRFILLFIPNNVPLVLIPYIMIIEIISYLSRVLSLAIRLSTNMIAGHTLIYIISWFGSKLNIFIKLFIIIPVIFTILILEFGVSIIQAYVLCVLFSTYIKDSINLH